MNALIYEQSSGKPGEPTIIPVESIAEIVSNDCNIVEGELMVKRVDGSSILTHQPIVFQPKS